MFTLISENYYYIDIPKQPSAITFITAHPRVQLVLSKILNNPNHIFKKRILLKKNLTGIHLNSFSTNCFFLTYFVKLNQLFICGALNKNSILRKKNFKNFIYWKKKNLFKITNIAASRQLNLFSVLFLYFLTLWYNNYLYYIGGIVPFTYTFSLSSLLRSNFLNII